MYGVLSDNCLACHGPDPYKRMANLRLDIPLRVFESGIPAFRSQAAGAPPTAV
jgi:hypothetical protein